MENNLSNSRIDRLANRGDRASIVNIGYSKFVRVMRLALPLAAMLVVAILFLRSGIDETLVTTVEGDGSISGGVNKGASGAINGRDIARNELINPKFETMDKKNQPYKIVAKRALQGEKNKDLIMLELPVGVMTMNDGVEVTVQSKTGAYRQDTQRFFLQGDVIVKHGDGYKIYSDEAHIDLKKNFAWSEKNVHGKGPKITINAKGMRANVDTGEVVFIGPAKLVLENGLEGI